MASKEPAVPPDTDFQNKMTRWLELQGAGFDEDADYDSAAAAQAARDASYSEFRALTDWIMAHSPTSPIEAVSVLEVVIEHCDLTPKYGADSVTAVQRFLCQGLLLDGVALDVLSSHMRTSLVRLNAA